MEKIGNLSFVNKGKEYFTEFKITPKIKEYLENEKISLATLIPGGWDWYDGNLFDTIVDDDGNYDQFGKEFEVIYYGIVESRDLEGEEGFEENIKEFEEKIILKAATGSSSVKDPNKTFDIKYIVIKK